MVDRDDWNGLIAGSRSTTADRTIDALLEPNQGGGGSCPFLARDDQGDRYKVKALNNPQGERIVVTEQIVGRVGRLIGAPVCEVRTVEIPAELVEKEWIYCPRQNLALEAGIAHGSVLVPNADLTRSMAHRKDDENSRRHAYLIALYDWCWGDDTQWLITSADENKYYSHDHGYYLPPGGQEWSVADLEANADNAHELPGTRDGLDGDDVAHVADVLEDVNREALVDAIRQVPEDWPVTDEELETVGYFLEKRAPRVAERLAASTGRLNI